MTTDSLSATFAALADPTRRAILARLASGETSVTELAGPFRMTQRSWWRRPARPSPTVTELAGPFRMTLPAVSKHLKVLQRAGLITRGRQAQWRLSRLRAAPLKEVADWVEPYRQFWEESFDRLDEYLKEIQMKEKESGPGR